MGMADSYKIELSRLRSGGATNGQVLTYSTTTGTWYPATGGGGGTPAGSDTYIQYNNAGAFGASAAFKWDDADARLYLGVAGVSGAEIWLREDGGGGGGSIIFQHDGFKSTISCSTLTGDHNVFLPDAGGTIALVSGNDSEMMMNVGGTVLGSISSLTWVGSTGLRVANDNDFIVDDPDHGLVLTSPDLSTARMTIDNSDVLQGVTAHNRLAEYHVCAGSI